jgi:Acetyltransferase (GNAT) family
MITFATVALDESREAYQWHRGFSSSNDSLFPRSSQIFEAIVMDGYAWSAKDEKGDYLALAYACLDTQYSVWELGGLMVARSERGKGVGSALTRLTLGHLLFEENPLELNQTIITHVLKDNSDPRNLIQHGLKFRFVSHLRIPAHELPGLRANSEGFIEGDEFQFVIPDSLIALLEWLGSWDGQLKNKERANIILRPKISLENWAAAFRDMVRGHLS